MPKEKKLTKKRIKQLERRFRRKKFKEWADNVKNRDKRKCIYCGAIKWLNAHHIIPREIEEFRWDLDNGVSLCPKHHKFSREFSAHKNSLAFILWLSRCRTLQYKRLVEKWDKYIHDHVLEELRKIQ
jgi:hypothetical protein